MKARDDDRQPPLSQKTQKWKWVALPSPEAKRPFQRQRAWVNRPLFVSFLPALQSRYGKAHRQCVYFDKRDVLAPMLLLASPTRNGLGIALLTGGMEIS